MTRPKRHARRRCLAQGNQDMSTTTQLEQTLIAMAQGCLGYVQ